VTLEEYLEQELGSKVIFKIGGEVGEKLGD
jgi:hypothetical protein